MNTTSILPLILLILSLVGCQTTTEKLENEMKPFMNTHFPNATYFLRIQNDKYHLKIETDSIKEKDVNNKMMNALGKLYECFYNSSSSAATKSSFSISISTLENKWKTKEFSLFEMEEIFTLE